MFNLPPKNKIVPRFDPILQPDGSAPNIIKTAAQNIANPTEVEIVDKRENYTFISKHSFLIEIFSSQP